MLLAPLDIFIPGDAADAALVSFQRDAAAQVLCNAPAPAGLVDRAVHGLDLVPALLRDDVGQIARGELLAGGHLGKVGCGGVWGRRLRGRGLKE